ncbi:4308_t:CDS:2 [Paraglomus occultum]|uniref:4308_t:CDS:1 n=1 Tax=Paraglomus occultum TaxID=144539 RepID=A0A9N8ZIZ6_9GLOM|nr:4308_t:CDS:2 [Paraglomus occultum]
MSQEIEWVSGSTIIPVEQDYPEIPEEEAELSRSYEMLSHLEFPTIQ